MECTIYVHVLDFFFRSIAVNITVYITYLFYLPMYCAFPVVIFVFRNIASYLPEFRSPQRVQCTVCIICRAFFISFGLMLYCLVVRESVSHATGPGSYSALCVIICLVLLDFSGKWTVKYITLRYWTFAVFLLEKRH